MSDTIVMPKAARLQVMIIKVPQYLRNLTLRLYKNDYTPDIDSDSSFFTEADFPGYASQSLNDFGDPYLNADNEGESDSDVHTWTCTDVPDGGSQTIYGWYTEDPDVVIGPCARFEPDPIVLTGAGQSLSVQILFEDGALLEEE